MDAALGIHQPEKHYGPKTGEHIRGTAENPAAAHFNHTAHQPQKYHVAQQMLKAAMQKHMGEKGDGF
jgi:hypothetical protein